MHRKKITTVSLIFAVLFSIAAFSCFAEDALMEESEPTMETPYQFPITPEDAEWKEFETKAEALEVCQIPETILHQLTTGALLETVLHYPFLMDYLAYDDYEIAAEVMEDTFNGCKELYSREDLTEVLLAKYSDAKLLSPKNERMMMAGDTDDFFAVSNLEFLLAYDQKKNADYTEAEEEQLEHLLLKNIEAREENPLYSAASNTYVKFMKRTLLQKRAINDEAA